MFKFFFVSSLEMNEKEHKDKLLNKKETYRNLKKGVFMYGSIEEGWG